MSGSRRLRNGISAVMWSPGETSNFRGREIRLDLEVL